MTKNQYHFNKIALATIFALGLLICVFWYPFGTALNMGYIIPDAIINTGYFYAILAFYYVVSLPCFAIVCILLRAINRCYKYSNGSAMRGALRKSTIILAVDLVLFFVGNIILDIFNVNVFAVAYYILTTIGLCVCLGFYHAYNRIK